MRIKQFFLFLIILILSFGLLGCGGTPESDDSEYSETMNLPVDTEYFELSRIIDVTVSEETEQIVTKKSINKYTIREVDLDIKDGEELRPVYAIVDFENRVEEEYSDSKSAEYKYIVIFEDGTISNVVVDKELNTEDEVPANLLDEYIMCVSKLKQGVSWVSPNGYYSEVQRYEYVALSYFSKTAPSFKIATYEHIGDTSPLYVQWWCPELGWFVQLQDYDNLNYFVLDDINFDWED